MELLCFNIPTMNFSFSAQMALCNFSGYYVTFSLDDRACEYSGLCSIFVLWCYFQVNKLHCQGNGVLCGRVLRGCTGNPLAPRAWCLNALRQGTWWEHFFEHTLCLIYKTFCVLCLPSLFFSFFLSLSFFFWGVMILVFCRWHILYSVLFFTYSH